MPFSVTHPESENPNASTSRMTVPPPTHPAHITAHGSPQRSSPSTTTSTITKTTAWLTPYAQPSRAYHWTGNPCRLPQRQTPPYRSLHHSSKQRRNDSPSANGGHTCMTCPSSTGSYAGGIGSSCQPTACLNALHAAHQGISGMTARAESSLFWLGITRDIADTRNRCAICNGNAPRTIAAKDPYRRAG